MTQVLAMPEIKERLAALGADVMATTPEQTAQFFRSELEKYTKVARAANIRGE
jgi:tripartite-type tricarboxylate transporter receptor subunit TctC